MAAHIFSTGRGVETARRAAGCGYRRALRVPRIGLRYLHLLGEGGQTRMLMNESLIDSEVADGFTLACQTLPESERVQIFFDG